MDKTHIKNMDSLCKEVQSLSTDTDIEYASVVCSLSGISKYNRNAFSLICLVEEDTPDLMELSKYHIDINQDGTRVIRQRVHDILGNAVYFSSIFDKRTWFSLRKRKG